ncbi:MAG: hypothetical protein KDD66_13655 [Bdellovibrionales bacterium]|nr:hypothetical protein [Bdellovibrionales bacterium]
MTSWDLPAHVEKAFWQSCVDILEHQDCFEKLVSSDIGYELQFSVEEYRGCYHVFTLLLELRDETFFVADLTRFHYLNHE